MPPSIAILTLFCSFISLPSKIFRYEDQTIISYSDIDSRRTASFLKNTEKYESDFYITFVSDAKSAFNALEEKFEDEKRKFASLEEQNKLIDSECPVCLDAVPNRIFIPCRHKACEECAPQLKECPLCRGAIGGLLDMK